MRSLSPRPAPVAPWGIRGIVPWLCPGRGPGWDHRPRVVRNLLNGTDLGHPLPPMLTDLPIGAWVMSAPLDAAGGPAAEGAADLLVTAGVVAAVPTAAAG